MNFAISYNLTQLDLTEMDQYLCRDVSAEELYLMTPKCQIVFDVDGCDYLQHLGKMPVIEFAGALRTSLFYALNDSDEQPTERPLILVDYPHVLQFRRMESSIVVRDALGKMSPSAPLPLSQFKSVVEEFCFEVYEDLFNSERLSPLRVALSQIEEGEVKSTLEMLAWLFKSDNPLSREQFGWEVELEKRRKRLSE